MVNVKKRKERKNKKKRDKYNQIKSRRLRSQILTCFVFQFYFQRNHGLIQEGKPSEKVVIVQGELDGIDINDIANLEDSPRFVFIDEELENLIVDGGELTRSIYLKKKSGILQQFIDVHYNKRCRREYFFGNIVNQLGQHHFSCGALVSNLKEQKLFLIK